MKKPSSRLVLLLACLIPAFSLSAGDPKDQPVIQPVAPAEVDKYLQVPGPDWRDQIIYMIVTDRFNDGNPANSNQGAGEYKPAENAYYSGGDLKGILDKLAYIKGLGATTLWITPPVANQWVDPWIQYTGYHGYWAMNFKEVDKHYGTLDDYRQLSATLHKNGMYLIQDIVLNHTGNFFRWKKGWDKSQPQTNYELNTESKPGPRPTQPPFDQNDPRDKEQKKRAIYHWTPDIRDYKNDVQRLTYQMSSLDDLNTANPEVRTALRDSYNYWIKTVGVDGFRIDTIKYVEHELLNDFLHNSTDAAAPGATVFAKSLGKANFFVTGENLVNGKPFDTSLDADVASYQGTPDKPEVLAPLNFPLTWDLKSVFTEGVPTSALTARFASIKQHYRNPDLLPNFIDSHDIDRFLKSSNKGAFQQALALVFTIPGIPTVLYGTEQDLTQSRGALFATGYDAGGKDRFDTTTASYKWLQSLAALRKSSPAFTRGTLAVLRDTASGSGVFVYRLDAGKDRAWVLFNTASSPRLLDNVDTGLVAGDVLDRALTNSEGLAEQLIAGQKGKLTLEVPGQAVAVYFAKGGKKAFKTPGAAAQIQSLKNGQELTGPTTLTGTSQLADTIELVIDGATGKAPAVKPNAKGAWSLAVDVENLASGPHTLAIKAAGSDGWTVSEAVTITVNLPFQTVLTEKNPVAHHLGPEGRYLYPTDGTFKTQMDLEEVSLATAGKSLRITIKPKGGISTSWNPQNGFDHVSYNIFVGLPGQTGATVMPFQNGQVPAGMSWTHFALIGGWANFLYTAQGATATSYGTPAKPAGTITVDKEAGTVSLTLQAEALGFPATLKGTKVYMNTWDYDGIESANRSIEAKPGAYIFGGGDKTKDVLYNDDTKVLTVP